MGVSDVRNGVDECRVYAKTRSLQFLRLVTRTGDQAAMLRGNKDSECSGRAQAQVRRNQSCLQIVQYHKIRFRKPRQ